MKKNILIVITILLSLACLTACTNKNVNNNENKKSFDENKTYYLNLTNVNNFEKMYNAKKPSVIVISQTTCSHCEEYKPILNRTVYDNNINIYVMEFDKLTGAEQTKITEMDDAFTEIGTPYTIIVGNGEIIDDLSGTASEKKLIKILKKNDII